jgi:hypothetical protein
LFFFFFICVNLVVAGSRFRYNFKTQFLLVRATLFFADEIKRFRQIFMCCVTVHRCAEKCYYFFGLFTEKKKIIKIWWVWKFVLANSIYYTATKNKYILDGWRLLMVLLFFFSSFFSGYVPRNIKKLNHARRPKIKIKMAWHYYSLSLKKFYFEKYIKHIHVYIFIFNKYIYIPYCLFLL